MTEKPESQSVVVWVRWFDASYQRGECSLDDLTTQVELESAGILVREDEQSVSIALDQYQQDRVWRYIEHIPKVNIRELRRLPINA